MLDAAQAARDKKKDEEEKLKRGNLRIGNSGVVTDDGRVLGTCHRITLARLLGIEEAKSRATKILFQAGELLEEGFAQLLTESGAAKVLRSDDISIETEVNGRKLTGRPDVVLADENGKPVLGLEHKGVLSLGTAQTVYLDKKPKPENLAQTGAYSHYLGIPFVLHYTNASYYPLYPSDKKKYGMSSIGPFYRMFYTEWRDGTLYYRADDSEEWVKSLVTAKGIEDYFKLVNEMVTSKDLGPRVSSDYMDGTPNKWDKPGDLPSNCKFCFKARDCDKYDAGQISFDEWIKKE
jgi:hypothetical protein